MRVFVAAGFMTVLSQVALAQEDHPSQGRAVDPEKQALAYELQECVGSKIRTSTQLFALRAQLESATKRAEEAEAKLKAAEKPSTDR